MVYIKQSAYSIAAQEDRCTPRFQALIPATLRHTGGKKLQTVLRDISRSGFSATILNPIAPRTRCWLTLPEQNPVIAQSIWWNDGILGCAFELLLTEKSVEDLCLRWS